ncbi:VOC family protein [Pelagibius litoralis]|uniref:VOC family protein n=1 Tax=Pelagibius litoralis TaxID=374515 RepID=A0A967F0C4_9PROT|nr:VOC family protein [Pelagibius litoralis]NIA70766.1 VOC family protein [Pelagibius litoralis]
MEQRLTMVTLGVRDLARAQAFYEQGLGWTLGEGVEGQVAFYQLGGMLLGLYNLEALAKDAKLRLAPLEPGKTLGGITLAYNVRDEAAVDAALAEAEAAGATILKPAEKVFWGGYSGYFADPDGHPWEVAFNPFWTLNDDGSVTLGKKDG